jgi:hypothetical protein
MLVANIGNHSQHGSVPIQSSTLNHSEVTARHSRVSRFGSRMMGAIRTTTTFRKYHDRQQIHPLGGMTAPLSLRLTLTTIAEEDELATGVVLKGADPTSKLEVCIDLLSSTDIDQNRVGMQRLMVWTKSRLKGPNSSFQASHAIVYGGGPTEDRLRRLFVTFLSDEAVESYRNKNDEVDSDYWLSDEDEDEDDESVDSEDDEEGPRGKGWGALHTQALRVVVNALEQMISSEDAADAIPIDFLDSVWRTIVSTLIHNVEECHNTEITGFSLKALRLLHTFEPVVVAPLLQHTLLPHLAHLVEYGKSQRFPVIESEASRLLKRAEFA